MITRNEWAKYEPLADKIGRKWARRSPVMDLASYTQLARYGILRGVMKGKTDEGYLAQCANNAVMDGVADLALMLTRSQNTRIKRMWGAFRNIWSLDGDGGIAWGFGDTTAPSSDEDSDKKVVWTDGVLQAASRGIPADRICEARDTLARVVAESGLDTEVVSAIFESIVDGTPDEVVASTVGLPVRRVRWYRTRVREAAKNYR